MTDSRSSSGCATALGLLQNSSCFRGEVCSTLPCACAETLAAALRTPALSSGEVEPVAWQYRVMYDERHARRDEWCDWRDAGKRYYDKVNAEIVAGATRVQTRALCVVPTPQAQPTPPFSRWADTIESASLTISPKGSEVLDALAAEVRTYAGDPT